MNTEAGLVA